MDADGYLDRLYVHKDYQGRGVATALCDALEQAVDEIEQTLSNTMNREVTSLEIGEQAMQQLKNIDEVAYVRFASVYRQFSDINTFMDELKELLDSNQKRRKNK